MVDIHLLYNHLAECNLWIMSSPPPSTCLTPPLHFIPRGFCGTKLLEISFAPIHLDLHLSKFCAHKWGSSSTSSSTNPCVFPRSCDFLRRAHRTRFEKPGRILKPRRCTEKFHRKLKFFPRLFHTHRWRILNDVLQPEASGQIIKTQTKGIWGDTSLPIVKGLSGVNLQPETFNYIIHGAGIYICPHEWLIFYGFHVRS